jgi:lipopolysaccharide/colanic/teichoic acid biosynthesis glycosyltransferase
MLEEGNTMPTANVRNFPVTPPTAAEIVGELIPAETDPGIKRCADLIFAVLLLIATAPIIALVLVLVKLTSRGPAIYRQKRLGYLGKPYTIYKVRTMAQDCEKHTGPQWSSGSNDPRVTSLGRFLRQTHLDELPQLWNVIRGDMSLVGPRPERPEFVLQLERQIPRYRDRLSVLPGVTGLAQIQLPPDTDLESVRRKLACDLYYVQRMSPGLDLRIMLSTVTSVAGIRFSVPQRLLRIPSGQVVETAYEDLVRQNPTVVPAHVQPA